VTSRQRRRLLGKFVGRIDEMERRIEARDRLFKGKLFDAA